MFGLFRKKMVLTGRVIKAWEHKGWGNNIEWSDYKQLRIVGWLPRKPIEHDEIQFEMLTPNNKKVITRFIVTDVEHAEGVHDMFFATVKPFAYAGEPITDKSVVEAKQ